MMKLERHPITKAIQAGALAVSLAIAPSMSSCRQAAEIPQTPITTPTTDLAPLHGPESFEWNPGILREEIPLVSQEGQTIYFQRYSEQEYIVNTESLENVINLFLQIGGALPLTTTIIFTDNPLPFDPQHEMASATDANQNVAVFNALRMFPKNPDDSLKNIAAQIDFLGELCYLLFSEPLDDETPSTPQMLEVQNTCNDFRVMFGSITAGKSYTEYRGDVQTLQETAKDRSIPNESFIELPEQLYTLFTQALASGPILEFPTSTFQET